MSDRASLIESERLSVFIESEGWATLLRTADEDVLKPLRAKALTNAGLDPREQTGVVRAIEAVRRLLVSPYERLAATTGKPLDEVLPERVTRLFT